ncbi:hypothetical protein C7N83_10240 [Neisseria iguanae]|uniref:Uncharacterized protein n=1 Tax=Neisseria iguanae TaxID=90242 RepID=A0A2P7TYF9_9NEIS|nr:hypothetical protein C7N83_10240 [Neisseria iguanae]
MYVWHHVPDGLSRKSRCRNLVQNPSRRVKKQEKSHLTDLAQQPRVRPLAEDIKHFVKKHPNLKGRIFYVHGVPLPFFLRHGIGMATINNTSGLSALIHNMPVKVLGRAHDDIPGITHQGKLADLWKNPTPPDSGVFHAYRMYHIDIIQINGNFYSQVNFP